jgi:hypothetical protein
MKPLKSIGLVLIELFVEDVRLTTALAIWIAIIAATRPWWRAAPQAAALALFAGVALILCGNVMRVARRTRR